MNFSYEKQSNNEAEKMEINQLVTQATVEAIGMSKDEVTRSINYVLRTQKGNELTFFGAHHTNDSKHPQFEQMQSQFASEFANIPKENAAVIIEYAPTISTLNTLPIDSTKAIQQGGEAAFAINLANTEGIDYFLFEPPLAELIDYIATTNSRELSFLHFAGRNIMNFSSENKEGLRAYLQPYIDRCRESVSWENFDFSFTHLEQIYKQVTGNDFTPDSANEYKEHYNPRNNLSVLNEVSRTEQIYRDTIVVENIAELIRHGKTNIFIVYGSGHAITQHNALEHVLNNN